MDSQRTPQITLYGNLGADPETKTLPARTVTREVYDPALEDVVTRDFDQAERQIHTASLAVNGKDGDGNEITSWLGLVDFEEHLTGFRKGDRLKVYGRYRTRTFTAKGGEEKTVREIVVIAASLEKRKARAQAAPAPESDPETAPKARSRRKAAKARRAEPEPPPPSDDDIPF
jgi:single-strand DNA-binding protein